MKAVRILVVEDDQDIAALISLHLRDAGYLVDTVHDGLAALQQASFGRYELIVLDLMLPRLGGLELCQSLRAKGSDYSLILMLTARSSEIDRVLGLEIGADDYLTKPFSLRELQARVKALLRRKARLENSGQAPPGVIRVGALSIDADTREVSLSGAPLHLTAKEFDLLWQFAQYPGRVYTRAQLLDLVWGYGYDGFDHTVNSHINRLRGKIERDPANPDYIQTVWGVGYKFTGPAEATQATVR